MIGEKTLIYVWKFKGVLTNKVPTYTDKHVYELSTLNVDDSNDDRSPRSRAAASSPSSVRRRTASWPRRARRSSPVRSARPPGPPSPAANLPTKIIPTKSCLGMHKK